MPSRIDAITVSYNSEGFLPRLSEGLRGDDLVASVTVVDNLSRDRSVELARGLDWGANADVIVNGRNAGFGSAMNLAASAQPNASEYLLIINPDVAVPAGVLDKLVQVLDSRRDVAAIGVQLVTSDGAPVSSARSFPTARSIAARRYTDVAHNGTLTEADWLCGALMLWRRRSFDAIGGFDDNFFLYFEDVDICARARRGGEKILIDGSTTVIHDQGHGERPSPKLRRENRRSRRRYARKWLGIRGLAATAIADAGEVAAHLYHSLRGTR